MTDLSLASWIFYELTAQHVELAHPNSIHGSFHSIFTAPEQKCLTCGLLFEDWREQVFYFFHSQIRLLFQHLVDRLKFPTQPKRFYFLEYYFLINIFLFQSRFNSTFCFNRGCLFYSASRLWPWIVSVSSGADKIRVFITDLYVVYKDTDSILM